MLFFAQNDCSSDLVLFVTEVRATVSKKRKFKNKVVIFQDDVIILQEEVVVFKK